MMGRFTFRALVLAVLLTGCATTAGSLTSEGRAGIEGEPILLGSRDLDPKYKDYFARVRQMIKEKWGYPCVKHWFWRRRCDYKETQLVIDFGILKDGSVPYVIVQRPSQFGVYNEYAVKAVKAAAPFPPIPESVLGEKKGLPIRAVFDYVVITPYGYL